MYILHGTWVPKNSAIFDNNGIFLLWAETEQRRQGRRPLHAHPFHLDMEALVELFGVQLPLSPALRKELVLTESPLWLTLPSRAKEPLASPEMARTLGLELPDSFDWRQWRVNCLRIAFPMAMLKELHYQVMHLEDQVQLGSDLVYWYRFGRELAELVAKDQYIPALLPHSPEPGRGRKRKTAPALSYEPAWEFASPRFSELVQQYARAMPGSCAAASLAKAKKDAEPVSWDPEGLLRHYAAETLNTLFAETPFTQKLRKQVEYSFIEGCIGGERRPLGTDTWRQWRRWRDGLVEEQASDSFSLGFRLRSASEKQQDRWRLEWLAVSRRDPSLQIPIEDYWSLHGAELASFHRRFGKGFRQALLLQLGHAARIYPLLWQGMSGERPSGMTLSLDQALEFLRESAWVLEDAGYKVIVPAWWTPRAKPKPRLRAKASAAPAQEAGGGWFGLPSLVQYDYQLVVGGEPVSPEEWRELVNAKADLVRFRGEWVELDREHMAQMLAFWEEHKDQPARAPLLEVLQRQGSEEEDTEWEYDGELARMLEGLRDAGRLQLLETPPGLHAELREYQKRGLSWLDYLEHLGLNPCLADDMGLGKTIQVIALLVLERDREPAAEPTLLIAPTSVLGNWYKELERFAPGLRAHIHHGTARSKGAKEFATNCKDVDMVITSFALARRDAKLFAGRPWRRVVVDEAQNIKNPKSAQTRAIMKLKAEHRIALTGTPIENRLMDLWSIFHFLNPGYLGSGAQFKKAFETPIQKNEDRSRSAVLKRLVEPFILRRMKTDKAIIRDLPDKIEQKVYCNLSPEQASLYQAVVDDVQEQIEEAEGMQRRGLILSTLMRLKQVCNHPAQFLHDGSEFSEQRSHKLGRVAQMVEEVIAEGESLLLFTQFTDIGEALERHFRQHYHYATYYLHGGTSRTRREKMIAEFQDPDSPPAVFILSLKAGGVGITLTRANHVFHFDRWWNPAVENQATDRAFRIGQTKKVMVHKMVALGTLEERIDQMLEEKQRLSDSIVGSDEAWLTELDNDAFRQLIELNREAVLTTDTQ